MHRLYKLKNMLCEELDKVSEDGKLTAGSLDTVDKLSHAIKNIDKIIDFERNEGGYSGDYMPQHYSYAPRRGTHYVRGHYSRDDAKDHAIRTLEEIADGGDMRLKSAIERCISDIEKS